ncbi:hypothetical protein G5714_023066 [Onychostoma macrolepis]|uniref:Uncharacterized protein n=1 Tax=Onychostoma macrolepis TaxID=369639 RepID=A0A7J6BQ37_9TELE|nr:hypothetical protein G5714_023066 [Onychostoma macrolepis]
MHVSNTGQTWGVTVGTQQLEEVEKFSYLGSVISQNGDTEIKLCLFSAIVVPTAIYASETWKASGCINNRLDVFQQRCLRQILKIRFYDHSTNEERGRKSEMVMPTSAAVSGCKVASDGAQH